MFARIDLDLNKLVDFMFEEVECCSDFEEDEFCVSFDGHRLYVERYPTHYRIEIGHEDDVVEIPRH